MGIIDSKKIIIAMAAMAALMVTDLFAAGGAKVRKVILEPTEMRYGDSTRTSIPFAKDPTVIRLGDRYLMYYSVTAYEEDKMPAGTMDTVWHSGIAGSTDLIHWSRVDELKLYDTSGERIWGAVAPCVKRFGGKIHLFYQRKWKGSPSGNSNIWHAVSKDGINFYNVYDEPILYMNSKWSIDRSIDAEVYRVGNKLILLFATRETTGEVQMLGMAEAPYHSDYGPDKWTLLSKEAPLMKPDFPWEMSCIEAPTVIEHKGVYYLFYAGAYNHEFQQIGLATSTDGYNYTRIAPDGLFFHAGEEGTWNQGESGHPGVFQDKDGQVYLFFQGKASKNANYLLSVCKVKFQDF